MKPYGSTKCSENKKFIVWNSNSITTREERLIEIYPNLLFESSRNISHCLNQKICTNYCRHNLAIFFSNFGFYTIIGSFSWHSIKQPKAWSFSSYWFLRSFYPLNSLKLGAVIGSLVSLLFRWGLWARLVGCTFLNRFSLIWSYRMRRTSIQWNVSA